MRITDYFDLTVQRFPDKIAFADENGSISFSELSKKAKEYAEFLSCEKGELVEVEVDRSFKPIIKFLGSLYANRTYIPIDPDNAKVCARVKELKPLYENEYEEKPAYVLFTSGSTGMPKGVVISENSVVNFALNFAARMKIDENTVFGNQSPFFFDASMEEIYGTLFTGATTYIMPKKLFSFPKLFAEYINSNKINTLNLSASAFDMIALSGVLDSYPPKYLKLVMVGNEAVRGKGLSLWQKACPDVQFVNAYGPTELTVECAYYFADRSFGDDEAVPIGKPCGNCEIHLVDENENESVNGEGEMYVSGPGVALGYLCDPEKTAEAFILYKGKRTYKTGDHVRTDDEGNLVFIGRKDDQIKHIGYRIELGEIESYILSYPEIDEVCCVFDEAKDKIICAYSGRLIENDLAKAMRGGELPKYKLPNKYIRLEKLPKTANDKIDKKLILADYLKAGSR